MTDPPTDAVADLLPLVDRATERLLTTVADLPDEAWSDPSGCVGWSRGHVIAHLALNAEGLGGAVRGLLAGAPALMYVSNEARDADIAALAAGHPDAVRDRLRTSSAALAATLDEFPGLPDDASFERTPGGAVMRAHVVPLLRLREVEIHHADLRAGYTFADWPEETTARFLDIDSGRYAGPPLRARTTDTDRGYVLGGATDEDPEVSGPAAALAWWLTGRDPGDQLTISTGTLPDLEGR